MQTHEGIEHHDASFGWNIVSVEGSGLIMVGLLGQPNEGERP